jgi:hypothetical protein
MYFVVEYQRSSGKLVALRLHGHAVAAQEDRLAAELRNLRQRSGLEIVVLEADSEASLRSTHRRYFEALSTLSQEVGGTHSKQGS